MWSCVDLVSSIKLDLFWHQHPRKMLNYTESPHRIGHTNWPRCAAKHNVTNAYMILMQIFPSNIRTREKSVNVTVLCSFFWLFYVIILKWSNFEYSQHFAALIEAHRSRLLSYSPPCSLRSQCSLSSSYWAIFYNEVNAVCACLPPLHSQNAYSSPTSSYNLHLMWRSYSPFLFGKKMDSLSCLPCYITKTYQEKAKKSWKCR